MEFSDCYSRREIADIEGEAVALIQFQDLKRNKRASGRAKNLADLDELE